MMNSGTNRRSIHHHQNPTVTTTTTRDESEPSRHHAPPPIHDDIEEFEDSFHNGKNSLRKHRSSSSTTSHKKASKSSSHHHKHKSHSSSRRRTTSDERNEDTEKKRRRSSSTTVGESLSCSKKNSVSGKDHHHPHQSQLVIVSSAQQRQAVMNPPSSHVMQAGGDSKRSSVSVGIGTNGIAHDVKRVRISDEHLQAFISTDRESGKVGVYKRVKLEEESYDVNDGAIQPSNNFVQRSVEQRREHEQQLETSRLPQFDSDHDDDDDVVDDDHETATTAVRVKREMNDSRDDDAFEQHSILRTEIGETQSQKNTPETNMTVAPLSTPVATRTIIFGARTKNDCTHMNEDHKASPTIEESKEGSAHCQEETYERHPKIEATDIKHEVFVEHKPVFENTRNCQRPNSNLVEPKSEDCHMCVKQTIDTHCTQFTEWVTLRIQGRTFEVTIETLLRNPESIFHKLFDKSVVNDERLKYFRIDARAPITFDSVKSILSSHRVTITIDRDEQLFGYILNYMRTGNVTIPNTVISSSIIQEAKFYGLDALIHEIEKPLNRSDVIRILMESSGVIRLRGCNLQSADLRNLNLSSIDMSYCNLSHCTLMKTSIETCIFKGTMLNDADFCDCDGKATAFDSIDASTVNFGGSKLMSSTFSQSKLTTCRFQNTIIDKSYWKDITLTESKFRDVSAEACHFTYVNFRKCDLSGTNFSESIFESVQLDECKLFRVYLKNCQFSTMKFIEFDFTDLLDFSSCSFNKVVFRNTNFSGVNISRVAFSHCNFYQCNFEGVTFQQKSKIGNCTFSECNFKKGKFLQKTDIKFSEFESCDFRQCSLHQVEFADNQMKRVKLDGTTFQGCDINFLQCSQCSMFDTKMLDSQGVLANSNQFIDCSGFTQKTISQ